MLFVDLPSPFAIYENGSGFVIPNILPERARVALSRARREPLDEFVDSLLDSRRPTLAHNSTVEDVGRVWDFFLWVYLRDVGHDAPTTATRIEMLSLMLSGSPVEAWDRLRSRILADIEVLSGWSRSFQKQLAERNQIWRSEDGNYYQKESDGTVYRVIGAQTIEETRLDFITDQVVRQFGTIQMFLQFFSLLAIAQDFSEHPNAYHASMKALLQDREWPSLVHPWRLLQRHPVRTTIWRPPSNLCDPQWLAGDLLATLTDTLRIAPFEPARIPGGAERQLGPDYPRQADFTLDTHLRIGDEEAVVFQIGGRHFRWINAALESDTRVSVGLRANEDAPVAEEELNRCLSLLVWEHGTAISKTGGPMVGNRRELPYIISPRSIFSLKIDRVIPIRTRLDLLGPRERLVLSMFREAVNARSVFYSFLNYWKVIEVIYANKDQRHDWVDVAAAGLTLERERIAKILTDNARLSTYLDYKGRSAVVHVFRKPFVDPDSSEDFVRLNLDLPIVRSLAKIAIKTLPAFS
jgi:hypothetical protein